MDLSEGPRSIECRIDLAFVLYWRLTLTAWIPLPGPVRAGTYDFYRPAVKVSLGAIYFWSYLSRVAVEIFILDVPLSRIDPLLNGIQIVEWGSHDCHDFKQCRLMWQT